MKNEELVKKINALERQLADEKEKCEGKCKEIENKYAGLIRKYQSYFKGERRIYRQFTGYFSYSYAVDFFNRARLKLENANALILVEQCCGRNGENSFVNFLYRLPGNRVQKENE